MRLALALLSTSLMTALPAQAAETLGSGVTPSLAQNSAERPIRFADRADTGGILVLLMDSAAVPSAPGLSLTGDERAAIERAVAANGFTGKAGSTLSLFGLAARPRVLLVGTAVDAAKSRALALQEAAGKAAQDLRDSDAGITIAGAIGGTDLAEIALGYSLGQYRFDRYFSA
jgi:leucyl aminopeptidase